MGGKAKLRSLREAAEVAAGSMRTTAAILQDAAESLDETTDHDLQSVLRRTAGRLRAAADALVAEAAAGPAGTRLAASLGSLALASASFVLGTSAQAIVGDYAVRGLEAVETAQNDVGTVEQASSAAEEKLQSDVTTGIERIRQQVVRLAESLSRRTGGQSVDVVRSNGVFAEDLGVANARQRWVYLRRALMELREATQTTGGTGEPPGDDNLSSVIDELFAQLHRVRYDIEVLAETDDSLYPPQWPIRD